jgi:hypothetical protein
MNKDFVYLSLPSLPTHMEEELIEICKKITMNTERYKKFKSNFTEDINIAVQEYNTERVGTIPTYITDEIQNSYSKYFYGGVMGILGKTSSITKKLSVLPPHCDSQRRVVINYLLDTGGINVKTTIYNEKRKIFNLIKIETLNYNEVTPKTIEVIPPKKWHAFNAQRFHSVENIESERYYFSLILHLNPKFKKFKKIYRHLLM